MMSNLFYLRVLAIIYIWEIPQCSGHGTSDSSNVPNKNIDFRFDYTYSEEVEGWFKLHWLPMTFKEAKHRCRLEGAELAAPTGWEMALAMTHALTLSPPWHGVYIDVHATYATGEYQHNGVPLARMPVKWKPSGARSAHGRDCIVFHHNSSISNEDCAHEFPFLCYKKKTQHFHLNPCGTVDNDYKFEKETGSCYKFHKISQDWKTAVVTCAAEGAYLAVVNDAKEMTLLQSITKSYPANSITSEYKDRIFLGFTDLEKTGEWTTVLGKSLVDTYESWHQGEPNNENNSEYCGNLRTSGRMYDIPCTTIMSFICEKHPSSLLSN